MTRLYVEEGKSSINLAFESGNDWSSYQGFSRTTSVDKLISNLRKFADLLELHTKE